MDKFMEVALLEAQKAEKQGEVPIGAVLVRNGKIIAKAHNRREKTKNALMHAEIIVINKACKKLHDWRLEGCTLYVTLEPCPMCAGAILNSRIDKVFYAAKDKTSGDNMFATIVDSIRLNHKCQHEQLLPYEKQASNLLSNFFKTKRKNTD